MSTFKEEIKKLFSGPCYEIKRSDIHKYGLNESVFLFELKEYLKENNGVLVVEDLASCSMFSTKQINNYMTKLINANLVSKIEMTPYEIIEMIVIHTPKTSNHIKTNRKCVICKNGSYAIQEHHFPIRKEHGGTETISVCPNCHYTYHAYENIYRVNA